jgi:hypothetical protein
MDTEMSNRHSAARAAAVANKHSSARAFTPRSCGCDASAPAAPAMVCVLPAPVWPYEVLTDPRLAQLRPKATEVNVPPSTQDPSVILVRPDLLGEHLPAHGHPHDDQLTHDPPCDARQHANGLPLAVDVHGHVPRDNPKRSVAPDLRTATRGLTKSHLHDPEDGVPHPKFVPDLKIVRLTVVDAIAPPRPVRPHLGARVRCVAWEQLRRRTEPQKCGPRQHAPSEPLTLERQHGLWKFNRFDPQRHAISQIDDESGREHHLPDITPAHAKQPPQREQHQFTLAQADQRMCLRDAGVLNRQRRRPHATHDIPRHEAMQRSV